MDDNKIIWKQRYSMSAFKGKSKLIAIMITAFLICCCVIVMFWNLDSGLFKWLGFAGFSIIMIILFPFTNYFIDKQEFEKTTKSTYEFCTCCNTYTGKVRSEACSNVVKMWEQKD